MASLFALAAVVQFNDPDPLRWVAIYGAACALSAMTAVGRRPPRVLLAAVGIVALSWALFTVLGGPGASEYRRIFDAWEMRSIAVEQAREATGLFIVAAWMAVLSLRSAGRARRAAP